MSRFVSAGTVDNPEAQDDAWLKAQEQVEASKKPKVEVGKQEGGKSLYEVLQANKEAKQEAFEEQTRLKNQFRALDDDEVSFLDSVAEASRAKEAAVKQETAEQLEAFRKQRAAAEQASQEDASPATLQDSTSWSKKKKKRRGDVELEASTGQKLRRVSTTQDQDGPANLLHSTVADNKQTASHAMAPNQQGPTGTPATPTSTASKSAPATQAPVGLGLGDYSSDDDD